MISQRRPLSTGGLRPATGNQIRGLTALALGAALLFGSGCTGLEDGANVSPVTVSTGSAAAAISAYRADNGRNAVVSERRLNAIAARQARAMAKRGRIGHSVDGSFEKRLKSGGYVYAVAVENIAAGRATFDDALAGWKRSAGHRANLLKRDVTQFGVGAARVNDRYGTYWALVLAKPKL